MATSTEYYPATTMAHKLSRSDDKMNTLDAELHNLLMRLDDEMSCNGLGPSSATSASFRAVYKKTLHDGLTSLLGRMLTLHGQAWDDAITYARQVILQPKDTDQRATSSWARSCSQICTELMQRFGSSTIQAAHSGSTSILDNFYHGEKRLVAHINKKASFMRYCRNSDTGAAFYPKLSPLAIGCYQTVTLPCTLVSLAWLPLEEAVISSHIAHVGTCDDHSAFTEAEHNVRLRMVALATGAAYKFGHGVVSTLTDGTVLQATGAGFDRSVESAMAWRAVGGGSTPYSPYNFGHCKLEEGLIPPIIMVATHDIFDWRADIAAGNCMNGVSAVYGMGIDDAFHTYLEAILKMAISYPRPGIHAIGGMVVMHFTSGRYGGWEYHGKHDPACERCVELVRTLTAAANFEWAPKPPPQCYSEGDKMREWGRLLIDHFQDHGIMQEAVSWFQYLIYSGRIWLFDVTNSAVDWVDDDTEWE